METLEHQQMNAVRAYNPEARLRNDTETWLAEVLPGGMRTPFEYTFDGRELYALDGSELGPIFTDAIKDAEAIADKRPNLLFELRRRQIEHDEYQDMLAMARGEGPNTMVVVSDFPAELMDSAEDVGGYNVRRRQTMLRVITRKTDGRLEMYSQSLDYSERTALENIYSALGFKARPGELLGQRMRLDTEAADQETLVDDLMDVYDRSLQRRYGGEWHAGRRDARRINTYDFVLSQAVLLDAFTREASNRGHDQTLLYDLAAEMTRRFMLPRHKDVNNGLMIDGETAGQALLAMHTAGQQARREGQVFSGCGRSLGTNGTTIESEMTANGYGNKTNTESKYNFDKNMHCVVCQAPPKKGEKKKMCGPCGICKGCDGVLKAKKK
jgi:hypothetical protein